MLHEIIELHHLGTTVRLGDTKPHRSERARDFRSVVIFRTRLRKNALVHQPVESIKSNYVGLCLLESGLERTDCLTDVDFPVRGARICRSDAVTDLVHHDHRQVSLHRCERGLIRPHEKLGDRQNDVVHARIHVVLEEDALASFLLVNAGIIRKVVSDRLITMAQITSAERGIHHFHRRLTSLL